MPGPWGNQNWPGQPIACSRPFISNPFQFRRDPLPKTKTLKHFKTASNSKKFGQTPQRVMPPFPNFIQRETRNGHHRKKSAFGSIIQDGNQLSKIFFSCRFVVPETIFPNEQTTFRVKRASPRKCAGLNKRPTDFPSDNVSALKNQSNSGNLQTKVSDIANHLPTDNIKSL